MRVDIFIKKGQSWACYCQSVTLTNARNITAALESQGEHVGLFRDTKCLGKQVYETPELGSACPIVAQWSAGYIVKE